MAPKSHERRSLVGCSPRGPWESDTTNRLHFHFSLPCIGEGNGNPLQCSCLENPRDRGAWWAAVYGVSQSRTRLKPLSSSSRIQGYSNQTEEYIVKGAIVCCCSVAQSCPTLCNPMDSAQQASPCHPISQILPKLMSVASVTPSCHLTLWSLFSSCSQSLPASGTLLQWVGYSYQVTTVYRRVFSYSFPLYRKILLCSRYLLFSDRISRESHVF